MTRRVRVGLGVAFACLLTIGCSGGGGDRQSADEVDSTTSTATATDGAPRSGDAGGGDSKADTKAGSADDTPDTSDGGDGQGGGDSGGSAPVSGEPDVPTGIVTSISPSCAGRGTAVRTVVNTDPLADVSYAVAFSDGDSHGPFGVAQADLKGQFVWNIVVPTSAALGDADVIIVSGHPEEGAKEGRGTIRVTESGACP